MPSLSSGNTHAPAVQRARCPSRTNVARLKPFLCSFTQLQVMVGEKGAHMIIEDRQWKKNSDM
jgi:hypothetical protein